MKRPAEHRVSSATEDVDIVPESPCGPVDNAVNETDNRPQPEPELKRLVPVGGESGEKLQKIMDSCNQVFSGRFDAASVCGLLGTLDEADLRSLRDHLHAALPDAIPATAGRQLARRNAGSSARLVEDCWAFGFSIANGVLTSRAHSCTLRPAGRNPLEPLPPPSNNMAAFTNSMEDLVASQLRMEKNGTAQQRDIARLSSEIAALRGLHEEVAELRELRQSVTELRAAVSDRDSRIAHLEAQVAERLSSARASPVQPSASPTPERARDFADNVARLINIDELGASIAAAMHSRAGDSDSEASDDPVWPSLAAGTTGGARRRETAARDMHARETSAARGAPRSHPPGYSSNFSRNHTGVVPASARREESRPFPVAGAPDVAVSGTGRSPMTSPPAEADCALPFVLEGVNPEVADSRVRRLVQEVSTSLHNFQRVKRHSGAQRGLKAFRFDVDSADEAAVLNPASWPAGLRVRPWTVKPAGRQHISARASDLGRTAGSMGQHSSAAASSCDQLGSGAVSSCRPLRSAEGAAATRLSPAQPSRITGSGPASDLVATGATDASAVTAAFRLEGLHPAASDAQVRNLIWPLVRNLHEFHETRRGGRAGSKAYRIVVDAADSSAVLNPANWPAGLHVSAWPGRHMQPF